MRSHTRLLWTIPNKISELKRTCENGFRKHLLLLWCLRCLCRLKARKLRAVKAGLAAGCHGQSKLHCRAYAFMVLLQAIYFAIIITVQVIRFALWLTSPSLRQAGCSISQDQIFPVARNFLVCLSHLTGFTKRKLRSKCWPWCKSRCSFKEKFAPQASELCEMVVWKENVCAYLCWQTWLRAIKTVFELGVSDVLKAVWKLMSNCYGDHFLEDLLSVLTML